MNKYLINPISDFISKLIIQKIRRTFNREPEEFVEITENEIWSLLKEYQKKTDMNAEEFVKLGCYTKFLLIKLGLRAKRVGNK